MRPSTIAIRAAMPEPRWGSRQRAAYSEADHLYDLLAGGDEDGVIRWAMDRDPENFQDVRAMVESGDLDGVRRWASLFDGQAYVEPPPAGSIPNRDLARLLGMPSVSSHEMSPFLVMARNRAQVDPDGYADAACFDAMRNAALSRGHRETPGLFEKLAEMSRSGELDRLLSGKATPTLTRAVGRKMHRLGKNLFDIDEPVLHKTDPDRGRGQVVDYIPEDGKYRVQWDAFQTTEEAAGDLVKTALVAPPPAPGADARAIMREVASTFRVPPADHFREYVAARGGAHHALELVRSALADCGLSVTQEIRLIAVADDPYSESPIPAREARVLVRARSATGTRLEFEIPVRIVGDAPEPPTIFRFGGRAYALTPNSIHGLLRYYAIQSHPHQHRQFSPHPLTTQMPVSGNGEFAVDNLPTVRFASMPA